MMLLFLGRQRDVVSGETKRYCYWGNKEMMLFLGRQRDNVVVSGKTER